MRGKSFYKCMSRAKYWCFTINNYTEEEYEQLKRVRESGNDVGYIICGIERGEAGTPHLQGYVEFTKRKRLAGVKRVPGFSRAHLELRKGTQEQAVNYCTKDGRYFEEGVKTLESQGKRNDLQEVKEALDSGASIAEIAETHFSSYLRYERSLRNYQMLRRKSTARNVKVYVLWGNPGTGKTRLVFERYPSSYICCDPSLRWFDGYEGQDVILLDDYRGEAAGSFMLRFMDRYPMMLPVKGGFRPLVATKIFITSNMSPPFGHLDIEAAFTRRIRHVWTLKENIYSDENVNQLVEISRVLDLDDAESL